MHMSLDLATNNTRASPPRARSGALVDIQAFPPQECRVRLQKKCASWHKRSTIVCWSRFLGAGPGRGMRSLSYPPHLEGSDRKEAPSLKCSRASCICVDSVDPAQAIFSLGPLDHPGGLDPTVQVPVSPLGQGDGPRAGARASGIMR